MSDGWVWRDLLVVVPFILLTGCGQLNEDVSAHPIDTKLASCFRMYGIDNLPYTNTHKILKNCILQAIDAQRSSDENLSATLIRMGFDCGALPGSHCTLDSRQRMYALDYSQYHEIDAIVRAGGVENKIRSLSITEQSVGSKDNKVFGPFQTDDSVPSITQLRGQ